jgi:beta-galactosidase
MLVRCAKLPLMRKLSRRRFLQTAVVASATTQIVPHLQAEPVPIAYPENGTLIPDSGWRLWVDDKAAWQEDDIFLPEDISIDADGVVLAKGNPLPVNAPTGGWAALTAATGLEILLPSTVEQHFWGKYGAGADGRPRPYTPEEYRYAADSKGGTKPVAPPADDDVPQNGAYFGVSWWHRAIEIPVAMKGKRIFLHVRGAHLRAEVYLNRKLVGYSIMEELPFECDLTHAANPGGENHLAIRITNPFGRFDWVDGANAKWGHVSLYRSHGFGGLDRGMTISAHDNVRIKNAWILNKTDPNQIRVFVEMESPAFIPTAIDIELTDPIKKAAVLTLSNAAIRDAPKTMQRNQTVDGKLSGVVVVYKDITYEDAKHWDLDNPKLYHLKVKLNNKEQFTIAFGFRTFAPTGIGSNAMFRLNGRRIRMYTSISWGYWGLNGMWPVPELAEKEVTQAKKLGLNCLNFHRNLAKEDVLRAHDRLGLLRYMEPGAGKLAIGKPPGNSAANTNSIVMEKPGSEGERFAQKYMFTKCVEMVKAYRSHPSVIEYCLQNEIGADFHNPATVAILEAMRAEDPSRCIVLNDGFVAEPRKAAQAWFEPWNDKLHRSDEVPWGDWWNQHQGAGDQWYDEFYKSPTDFTYRAPFKNVLTEYGEMEGCARPDNHPLCVHQITETYKKYGGISYDLKDHEEVIAGYDKFLNTWGFRKAFPTSESLFLALGKTCYESWQNYLENARISDELDFAAISGWESTAIENHSGIVDNMRNFKADPTLISGSLLPVRPIAKQHALCIEQGKTAVFDLFLANDTPNPALGTLTFSMIAPSAKRKELLTLPAPEHVLDQFSYLLKAGFETPELVEEGLYRFKFSISSAPLSTQTKELWVTSLPINAIAGMPWQIGVSGVSSQVHKQLAELGAQYDIQDFKPGQKYHVIVSSGLTSHTKDEGQVGETTGESNPIRAVQKTTELGHLQRGILEAVQAGTPLLAIPQADSLSEGVARQLADSGAFKYAGAVGDFRAPWMGDWYFVREHEVFAGMPVNQAMGGFYQAKGRESNGLLVEGENVEVLVGYSRDHDRKVGAGTFTARLGKGKILYHRVPDFQPVMQRRFLANALCWLTQ